MSKAEKFIKDCTRNCSNELIAVESKTGKKLYPIIPGYLQTKQEGL